MDLDYGALRKQMQDELKEADFAKGAFIQYAESNFSVDSNTINNLADVCYSDSWFFLNHSEDAVPLLVSDLISGFECKEAAIFCSDNILSEDMQKEKQAYIKELEAEHPEFQLDGQEH